MMSFFKPIRPKRARKRRNTRDGMSDGYIDLVRQLPSCVSGRTPCEAHHLRIADERGVALKATDKWAVPLTPEEHTLGPDCVHSVGSRQEASWFRARGVDCFKLAQELWEARHSLETMEDVIVKHATWV